MHMGGEKAGLWRENREKRGGNRGEGKERQAVREPEIHLQVEVAELSY